MSDLPPLEQPQAYVVVGPNDQRGPYTLELLITEVLAERLSEATPVWWPGLADWTTMGAHPGISGELARRRGATSSSAPAWAAPAADPYAAPAADPYAAPTADPYAAPAADPYAAPAADPYAAPAPEPGPATDTFVPATGGDASPADEEPVDAEIIEVAEVVALDGEHVEVFDALVARSAVRAERQSRIDAVNEQLVGAVAAAVTSQGFTFAERNRADRSEELRFEGSDADMVMVSLGRAEGSDVDALREDHVPITITYRASSQGAVADQGSGEHGEVVVSADEWTGQSTSSVSLFLGLGDYLDDQLSVDGDALVRDVGAAVAVVRSKLA